MNDIYIIGAGGFGREVAWLIERINEKHLTWNIKGFIDDNEKLWGSVEDGYEIIGGCDYLKSIGKAYVVCAIASVNARKKIIKKLEMYDIEYAILIDPTVVISKRVDIGVGTIICAETVVSVDTKIGSHVIIDWGCTVGHDDVILDFVTAYPSVNISGNVKIRECVELGTGTQVIQGKRITENVIIGAGSVIVKDINDSGTYVGNPGRKIK